MVGGSKPPAKYSVGQWELLIVQNDLNLSDGTVVDFPRYKSTRLRNTNLGTNLRFRIIDMLGPGRVDCMWG